MISVPEQLPCKIKCMAQCMAEIDQICYYAERLKASTPALWQNIINVF